MVDNKQISYLAQCYRQFNKSMKVMSEGSDLMGHELEKGLSNEEIIRHVLKQILPLKYGVGKGKIVNMRGELSDQVDIIIFDKVNCPNLYVDANGNQVIPIEGVFSTIEVKSNLTKAKLKEAFSNAMSIRNLVLKKVDVSTNELVSIIPPICCVIAFNDKRKLKTVYQNYVELGKEFTTSYNAKSYSEKSPGIKRHSKDYFMISNIVVLGKGLVYHMYDGYPVILDGGNDAFGIFLVGLISHLDEMNLRKPDLINYYDRRNLNYSIETKHDSKFMDINEARRKLFPNFLRYVVE